MDLIRKIIMRKYIIQIALCAVTFFMSVSCSKEPTIDNEIMLDGDKVVDSALLFPEKYLTSKRHNAPSKYILDKPVVLAVHGFCATSFEWKEFFRWHDSSNFEVSLITLGGHGESYEAFKKSKWEDWQSSIKSEYEALVNLGFTNISLVGSSTGCPLILQLFENGYFADKTKPNNVILIDPIVVASTKLLSLVKAVGPMIGYSPMELTDSEIGYWYNFRSQETLQELQELLVKTRKDLQDGITVPHGSKVWVYKAVKDESADPISAPLIYSGLQTTSEDQVSVEMIDQGYEDFARRWTPILDEFSKKSPKERKQILSNILGFSRYDQLQTLA